MKSSLLLLSLLFISCGSDNQFQSNDTLNRKREKVSENMEDQLPVTPSTVSTAASTETINHDNMEPKNIPATNPIDQKCRKIYKGVGSCHAPSNSMFTFDFRKDHLVGGPQKGSWFCHAVFKFSEKSSNNFIFEGSELVDKVGNSFICFPPPKLTFTCNEDSITVDSGSCSMTIPAAQ